MLSPPTYTQLRVDSSAGVARVAIANPPVNVLGFTLIAELNRLLTDLASNDEVRVIVFESADEEFFIAHVDMTLGEDPSAIEALMAAAPEGLNPFQAVNEQLRHQPQVTIVKLAGIARGGGAEFVAAADMAFAAESRAALGQVEALMGILPGGGGTQYLRERVGRNRALELALGADLVDAKTAEVYGLVNRALPDEELDGWVEQLATHIAALAPGVAAAIKGLIAPADHEAGFALETQGWAQLVYRPVAGALMSGAMSRGAQTPEGERNIENVLRDLASGNQLA